MELKRSIKNFYEKKSSNKVKPDDIYSFYAGRGKRTGSIPTFDSFYAGRGKRNFAQNKDIFIAGRGWEILSQFSATFNWSGMLFRLENRLEETNCFA